MSFENPFNNSPQEMPEKKPEVKKEEKKEQVFSKEGLLNRNFGKDVEKPSEALFYKGGILNRPKFQEMAREQREQREKADAGKIQELREKLGMSRENKTAEVGEQPFSPEGLLNRNFGKNKEQALAEGETAPVQESASETPVQTETSPVENAESVQGKPLFQQMVEAYQKLSNDPEKSAYDALYNRLEPNLPEEEKQNQMKKLGEEYGLYKEGKDWKQGK